MVLNIHSLPFLVTSLLFFTLAWFVLSKGKKSAVNRGFFILGLSVAAWQFPYFIAYNLKDASSLSLYFKIAYIGLIFIAPAIYHFVTSFLNLKSRKIIYFFYGLSSIYIYLIVSGKTIIAGLQLFPWGVIVSPGNLYNIFLAMWFVPLILSLYHLCREYKKEESPYNKKRIKYVFGSLAVACLAIVDVLSIIGLKVYPFGFIFLIVSGFSTAYAIIRYRLLDIEVVVKKASLIGLGSACSISVIYLSAFYLQPYFYALGGKNWIIFPIFVSLFTGVGLFHFINFVRRIEEDELSKKFSYRPILKREAQRIATAHGINELVTYILRDLSNWMRLEYVGMFIKDAASNRFLLAKEVHRSKSKKKLQKETNLDQDSPLVIKLIEQKRPLVRSELEYHLENTKLYSKERDFLYRLVGEMKALKAEISVPSFCEEKLLAIINLGNKFNVQEIITVQDLEILTSLSNNIARALHGFMLESEKARLIVASQRTIISAIEAKDQFTHGHTERVAAYTKLLGEELKKDLLKFSHGLTSLNWSAELHDVGKIAIPDEILFKPGPLNKAEWAQIKEHPSNGVKIIDPVREWLGEDICSGILEHHENYDGSGYPFSKKGQEIHIFARIIRVADAFDAMISNRPYRPALSKEEAMDELKKYKDKQFDPAVVNVMEELYDEGKI